MSENQQKKDDLEPTANAVWKGENESDSEYVLDLESFPLDNTGVWTEQEAYRLYKQKVERLRTLYMGQLSRLSHLLQERRRQFLQEWQAAGGTKDKASLPSEGGSKHDVAYRCYRKRTSEQGLLERRLKLRRVSATMDLYSKKELREANKSHYQHLVKLQQQLRPSHTSTCSTASCNQMSMPFTSKCSKHIVEEPKQQLYTSCTFANSSGTSCTNPVPKYLDPLLCGGHWDQVKVTLPSDTDSESEGEETEKRRRMTVVTTTTLTTNDTTV